MLAPYQNSDERGAPQIAPEVLKQAMVAIDARGMHGFFHAIGDGAVRLSLDAIEAARKANGAKPTWHMVTHLNVVDPADQPRFARLSTFAQFQPTWASWYDYIDRKSTRLNSITNAHLVCRLLLEKKNTNTT